MFLEDNSVWHIWWQISKVGEVIAEGWVLRWKADALKMLRLWGGRRSSRRRGRRGGVVATSRTVRVSSYSPIFCITNHSWYQDSPANCEMMSWDELWAFCLCHLGGFSVNLGWAMKQFRECAMPKETACWIRRPKEGSLFPIYAYIRPHYGDHNFWGIGSNLFLFFIL